MSQRVPSGKLSAFRSEMGTERFTDFTMYNPPDWNNADIKPFKNSFDIQLDSLNCGGVPTRTTPTLTPTTLKNIEQVFMELQSDSQTHQNEAGFVPPLLQPSTSVNVSVVPPSSVVHVGSSNATSSATVGNNNSIFMSMVDTKSWQGGSTTVTDVPSIMAQSNSTNLSTVPPHVMSVVKNNNVDIADNNSHSPNVNSNPSINGTRRNIGGRRPNKENGISPEEEERRKIRRERNKLAAARCRKRRLDHTNELVEETEELEGKKQRLHEEIRQLQVQKEELEFLLEAHKPCCQLLLRYPDSPQDIKPYILDPPLIDDQRIVTSSPSSRTSSVNMVIIKNDADDTSIISANECNRTISSEDSKIRAISYSISKPRPNSLPVNSTFINPTNVSTDVSITTPSSGLNLNFDSLLEGGTGYTPITSSISSFAVPSCSVQQRNYHGNNNPDLISPDTVSSKLVSL